MATLTVQSISRTGLSPSYGAAAGGGDEFVNTGIQFFHAKNGSGGDIVVTFETPNSVDTNLAIADRTVTVTAGEERIIGPFPVANYNDANGKVQVTYDGVTSLTVGVFQLSS